MNRPMLANADAALLILRRMSMLVMWLTFAVFHLALAVAALFLLWALRVPSPRTLEWLRAARDSQLALWLGFLGVGALALGALYVKWWRKAYSAITTPYFFRDVSAWFEKQRQE